jgi:hypothetical protein
MSCPGVGVSGTSLSGSAQSHLGHCTSGPREKLSDEGI